MVRIPSEYQEVEYLASNGTQYIDTGVVPSITDVYSWSGEFRHINNAVLFGCRTSGTYKNDNQLYLNRSKSDAASGSVYGIFLISNAAGAGVEKRNIVLAWDCPDIYTTEASKISIEGYITENFKPTQSIYLFGFNILGTNNSSAGGGKLKFFKIDGRCNFIPCYRKSDSKPGMYDTVSKTFYTNSGTGEFLVGNNVYYDTTNLLESRRRILLTTPHLESPTPANPLTFKSNMSAKLKEGKVYFTPVQEGTGDPSPDNVRPISGWDGVTLNVNGTAVTLPFPKTIYGGYVDLVNGEVVEEWKKLTLTTSNTTVRATSNMQYPYYMRTQITGWKYGTTALISDVLASTQTNTAFRSTLAGWQMPNASNVIYWVHPDCATESGAESLRTGEEIMIMYKLATPIHHTIDPQVIRPLKGVNNIWSDANGNIEIKFWKH